MIMTYNDLSGGPILGLLRNPSTASRSSSRGMSPRDDTAAEPGAGRHPKIEG